MTSSQAICTHSRQLGSDEGEGKKPPFNQILSPDFYLRLGILITELRLYYAT